MRSIWKGAITFGLVNIPVALYPATRREELKFRLLRVSDQSPVNYKRVAEADGKEVPWDQIVKGYEYEKGKFVVLKEEDFARVDIEATQTVDILNFVSLDEVNPLLFYKPYYMEAGKGGDRAYVLLREALDETGKIAIAKVVIRTRQHLAAVKPQEHGLILELMHFPQEILDASEFKSPAEKAPSKPEMTMARQLISSMTDKWKPEQYTDEYRDALEKMIEDKLEHGEKTATPSKSRAKPTNVIDLVSVLQQSIEKTSGRAAATRKPGKKSRPTKARKKAA
ncbi:MAG TPA: Ku protein [Chthoniobacterales bacterium]